MKVLANKSTFEVTIDLPASKSESNRVLIINALANSSDESLISNLSNAKDTEVLVKSLFKDFSSIIDIGHAGTAMRFLTAYYALNNRNEAVVLTGSPRMQKRPINVLVEALNKLGAEISYLKEEGYPPLKIQKAGITKREISINASVSSQYISALLMIAPVLKKGLVINLKGELVSKPYLDMTIDLMRYFNVEVVETNNRFEISPQKYNLKPIEIESDWSAASYWFQILALSEEGSVILKGLKQKSRQGDYALLELFKRLGIFSTWLDGGLKIIKNKTFDPVKIEDLSFDLIKTPDLAQTLICACAGLGINASFFGLSTLKIKETNRLVALQKELSKFSVKLDVNEKGEAHLKGSQTIRKPKVSIETYNDHRMAMCFAPLALKVGNVDINNPEVVVKSYPKFWEDLAKVCTIEVE